MTLKDLLTAVQAAEVLGVSRRRVQQLRDEMNLGIYIGRVWHFTPEDLAQMQARCTKRGPKPK